MTTAKTTKSTTLNLLLAVRDGASTKGAPRALLNALILRSRATAGFTCFPSYRKLAEDTNLDESTLKRAAKWLEDARLIRRHVRPMHSNRFTIRVGVIMDLAETKRAERNAAKAEALAKLQDAEDGDLAELDHLDGSDDSSDDNLSNWGQGVSNVGA